MASLCNCDPMVLALVLDSAATHKAVQDGPWSSSTTWGGACPVDGSCAVVPVGRTVVVDGAVAAKWIRVDGSLITNQHVNTPVSVETLVVNDDGYYEVGSQCLPIQPWVTASVTFLDKGPIDRVYDPYGLSRGLLSAGKLSFNCSSKTPYVALAVTPTKGATTLTLAQPPVNWKVGDSLVVPRTVGSYLTGDQADEEVQILAISGNVITIRALLWDHPVPNGTFKNYVINRNRNITFTSQATDITRNGHVMSMSNNVYIANAGFYRVGRTDKTKPINDPVVTNGVLMAGTGTNDRARYSLHFHVGGTDKSALPAYVSGCICDTGPGWGFVNHASNVNFVNNVSYNIVGAGFVSERGDEIGSFQNNLALKETGSSTSWTQGVTTRENIQDFAHEGDGFWFQGSAVSVINNIAIDAKSTGFVFYNKGLIVNGSTTTFPSANLPDPSLTKLPTVSVQAVPITGFYGNVAFGSPIGLNVLYVGGARLAVERSFLDNFTAWNCSRGFSVSYGSHFTFQNSWLSNGTYGVQEGPEAVNDNQFNNLRVENFGIGIGMSEQDLQTVNGGYYNNGKNFDIPAAISVNRSVSINGVQSASPANNVFLESFVKVYLNYGLNTLFIPSTITLDGKQLFSAERAPGYVFFPLNTTGVPAPLINVTNQQLWDSFGLAVGGCLVPVDATAVAGTNAFSGTPVYLPKLSLSSDETAPVSSPYKLIWSLAGGPNQYDASSVTLVKGWNMFTRIIGGRPRTLFVKGI